MRSLPSRHQVRDLAGEHLALALALEVGRDLRHREEPHGDHREADAVGEFDDPEPVAHHPGIDVGADEAEQQPEDHHREPFHRIALREHAGGHEPHHHQRKVLGGAEAKRPFPERRTDERDQQGADASREERGDRRHREGRSGASLARHLIAIEAGHRGGRFARQVHENRGGGAAVLRAVVDPREHDERRHRGQREGEREQHPDRDQRADPGQDADQRAEQHAGEAVREVLQRERDREAQAEIAQRIHGSPATIG